METGQPPPDDTSVTVEIIQSKEQVFTIVRDVLDEVQADYFVEQRAHLRHPVCIPIEAIPFDREGNQAGPLFTAVTKDISAAGLSLLHHSVILDPYLMMRFPQSKLYSSQWIVVEVLRGRQVGPLWDIGIRSVAEPLRD